MKRKTTLQNSNNTTTATPRAQVIKLGLDVHADSIVVVRIVDGQTPQPAQRRRKQIIVALARQCAVDWWRIRTIPTITA